MKRILTTASALLLAVAAPAFAEISGAWTASTAQDKPGRVHVNLTRGHTSNMGQTMNVADLRGISDAQIHSAAQTPVQFRLEREAGTVAFEGVFKRGKGAGTFSFAPSAAYVNAIRSLGLELDLGKHRHGSNEDQLFTLAILDVSTDYIRSIQAEGFRLSLEKYLEMRIFNVTPEYIREMRSLGFRDITARQLVESKIHRVTPDYIRKMRAAGWDLSLRELQNSAIHGLTPEYAETMRKAGYNLDHGDLVAFRIHRVTPEYIRELRELGYANLPASKLLAARIHRVTPEYIREVNAAGYRDVPIDKLIAMRIHNIDIRFIERMNGAN